MQQPDNNHTTTTQLFDNQPLNMNELCSFLRAKKSTIYEYCRQGLPRFFVGKEARFFTVKVVDWLEERSARRIHPQETKFDPHKNRIKL